MRHLSQNRKKKYTQKGFSLIELMVSLSIFAIVMTISIGTLLIMIDVNAKAQALYSSQTNLSFALDTMTREIRTGFHYYCDDVASSGDLVNDRRDSSGRIITTVQDCDAGDKITFLRDRDKMQFGYRLNGEVIEQFEGDADGDGEWIPITNIADVEVDTFAFNVRNSDTHTAGADREQPEVDVFIGGRMNNGLEVETTFTIQTHIVQRRLDII